MAARHVHTCPPDGASDGWYAAWRRLHQPTLLAIVAWAETPPGQRVWPPRDRIGGSEPDAAPAGRFDCELGAR